jgi:hypothetical protein
MDFVSPFFYGSVSKICCASFIFATDSVSNTVGDPVDHNCFVSEMTAATDTPGQQDRRSLYLPYNQARRCQVAVLNGHFYLLCNYELSHYLFYYIYFLFSVADRIAHFFLGIENHFRSFHFPFLSPQILLRVLNFPSPSLTSAASDSETNCTAAAQLTSSNR